MEIQTLPSCLHSKCPTDWTISDVLGCRIFSLCVTTLESTMLHSVFVLDTIENDRVGYRVRLKLPIDSPTSRVRVGSLPRVWKVRFFSQTVGVGSFRPFQSTSSEAHLYLVCLAPASFPSSVSSVCSSQEQGTGFTQGQQACS